MVSGVLCCCNIHVPPIADLALFRSHIYGYSHVLAFMGIVATGVGVQLAIEAASAQVFIAEHRALLSGGGALFAVYCVL